MDKGRWVSKYYIIYFSNCLMFLQNSESPQIELLEVEIVRPLLNSNPNSVHINSINSFPCIKPKKWFMLKMIIKHIIRFLRVLQLIMNNVPTVFVLT